MLLTFPGVRDCMKKKEINELNFKDIAALQDKNKHFLYNKTNATNALIST